MAEGVLFDIAGTILSKLGSLALQEIVLLWGLNDELDNLQRTVSTIKAVLLDAEKQYSTSNQVKVWLDDLKDAVYDAEDLLDDISAEASRRQRMPGDVVVTKEVRLCFSGSNKVSFGLKMAHKIQGVRAKLDAIAEDRKFHLNPNHVEPPIVVRTHSSPPRVVIGRDDDKKSIISLLLGGDHHENVAVIPVVGFGGLGKTTLAQTVYNDEVVKLHFKLRIWVCVSDTFDVRSIIEKIIECVDGEKTSPDLEMEILKNKLFQRIETKKYLLVLDDVWNEDRAKWVQLYDLFVNGSQGSRIIITTRIMKVAEITSTVQPIQLKSLSEEESWTLFQQVAFKKGQAPSGEFEAMGKEIAARCCGLPLAIRTIGNLLYTKSEVSEWKLFKDEEFSKLDPESHIVETLKLSYNHLPSNLKQCFSYCSLFPKDYLFEVPMLINHWRSQGYIDRTSKRGPNGEDAGVDSFKYLLQGSFFQLADENDHGDEEVTCRMHDFMHDLAVQVAGEESNMVYPKPDGKIFTGKTRHISLHAVPGEEQWQHVAPFLQRRNARSLIVLGGRFNLLDQIKPGDKQCRAIVDKLRCLRVLTLQDSKINKLPSSLDRLNHLAHLDLSWNLLCILPDSITQLQNLQVLILDHCYKLRKLPRNINKLVNLIHLGLEGCDRLKEMPQGIGKLTSLEVLSRFSVSKKRKLLPNATGELDELRTLNKLRGGLEISNLRYAKKGAWECEAANLKDKPHLRSLSLEWGENHKVEDMSSEEKSLEALEPNVNLRELRLDDYGGRRIPEWVSSLRKLVKIQIKGCSNCNSLPRLDGLPSLTQLEVEKLPELEYITDNSEDTKGSGKSCFFPSLTTLILRNCPKLKGWWRVMPINGWMPQLPSLNTLTLDNTRWELLEEILKMAKPPSTSTSSATSLFPLQSLSIQKIEELEILQEEALQSLSSLKSLKIGFFEDTRVVSPWLHHLTCLESLSISICLVMNLFEEKNAELIQRLGNLHSLGLHFCLTMNSLPEGIQHLTSLRRLEIVCCDELESLPVWMGNLVSINHLYIHKCNHLTERCGSNRGLDWPSISHIPNIQVNFKWVQVNGRYRLGTEGASFHTQNSQLRNYMSRVMSLKKRVVI